MKNLTMYDVRMLAGMDFTAQFNIMYARKKNVGMNETAFNMAMSIVHNAETSLRIAYNMQSTQAPLDMWTLGQICAAENALHDVLFFAAHYLK